MSLIRLTRTGPLAFVVALVAFLLVVPQASLPAAAPPSKLLLDAYGDPLPFGAIARLGSMRMRHGNHAKRVCFLDEGKVFVSIGLDDTLRWWDAKTGKPLRAMHGFCDVSPDGKTLVAIDRDKPNHRRLIDSSTLKARCTIYTLGSVAISPDGKTAATCQHSESVCLWDAKTGELLHKLEKGCFNWSQLAFSPDSRHFAYGVQNGTIHLCAVASGKEIHRISAHKKSVKGLTFSPNSKILASVGSDQRLCFWDVESGKELSRSEEMRKGLGIGGFIAEGKNYVTGNGDGFIRIWEVATGKEIRRFKVNDSETLTFPVFIAPDGKVVASCTGKSGFRFWDLHTGKQLLGPTGHDYAIYNVAFSPDGKVVATGGSDPTLRLWETKTGTEIGETEGQLESMTGGMGISLDGKSLVAAGNRGDICIWNVSTRKLRLRFRGNSPGILSLDLSQDGKVLVIGGGMHKTRFVTLFSTENGKEITKFEDFENHQGWVTWARLSPNGKLLAVACQELSNTKDPFSHQSVLRLYDAVTKRQVGKVTDSRWPITSLAFSPDGKSLVVSAGKGNTFWIYELATLGKRVEWSATKKGGQLQSVAGATFSGSGRFLAFGGDHRPLTLWDVRAGEEVWHSNPVEGSPSGVAFFKDRYLASSFGGDTLVWDLETLGGKRAIETILLSKDEQPKLWKDLANSDACVAYRAIQKLWLSPRQGIALLGQSLKPVNIPDKTCNQIKRLVADLDSENFETRSNAKKELQQLGEVAIPALRRAVATTSSAEIRRSGRELLQRLETKANKAELLRVIRAVEVLEGLATPEANELLRTLAKGTDGFPLTEEATAALARLEPKYVSP